MDLAMQATMMAVSWLNPRWWLLTSRAPTRYGQELIALGSLSEPGPSQCNTVKCCKKIRAEYHNGAQSYHILAEPSTRRPILPS
jgi:hypothetical protein